MTYAKNSRMRILHSDSKERFANLRLLLLFRSDESLLGRRANTKQKESLFRPGVEPFSVSAWIRRARDQKRNELYYHPHSLSYT